MSLFVPYSLKGLYLSNRVVMAPMTRSRTSQPGNIPNAMMAEYYRQRASAGLSSQKPPRFPTTARAIPLHPDLHPRAAAGMAFGYPRRA